MFRAFFFIILVGLLTGQLASAQPTTFQLCSEQELYTECNGSTPLPNGTLAWIFWDQNSNGPDSSDALVPICDLPPYPPQALSLNSFPVIFEGNGFCSPGISVCGDSAFSPARFFLKVWYGQIVYHSNVFELRPGPQEPIWLSWWQCDEVMAVKSGLPAVRLMELVSIQPSPFNSSTTVKYDLSQATTVELKIYDLLGRELYSMSKGLASAGSHTVLWQGTDANGNLLTSGSYLIQLRTGLGLETKRVLLLR